jgi:hypothetical protein
VTEQGASEPPKRVTRKPDRYEDQEHLPEGLLGNRLQGAALASCLAARPDCELDGENANHAVDDAARDETRSRKRLEPRGAFDLLTGSFGPSDG